MIYTNFIFLFSVSGKCQSLSACVNSIIDHFIGHCEDVSQYVVIFDTPTLCLNQILFIFTFLFFQSFKIVALPLSNDHIPVFQSFKVVAPPLSNNPFPVFRKVLDAFSL